MVARRHTTKDTNKPTNKINTNKNSNIQIEKKNTNKNTSDYNQVLKPPRHSAVRRHQTAKRPSVTKEQPAVKYCEKAQQRVVIKKAERCISRLAIKSSSSESDSEVEAEMDSACSSKTSIKASLLVNNNYSPIKRPKPITNQQLPSKNSKRFDSIYKYL